MLTCRVAIVTLVLVVGSAIEVAAQEDEVSPSVPASPAGESATPAPTWLDEQTCIGPDFPGAMSAKGKSVGDLFNCAKALGHRKRDPDHDAYDFDLWRSTLDRERYTEQCDEGNNLIGSRYHTFGTDLLYNIEKKKRVVEGTFDFTVVSTLLDADEDIWQVEKQGVLWDVHAADEEWNWTWSVDATWVSEDAPEQPFLGQYRGVEPSEFQTVCDYLR